MCCIRIKDPYIGRNMHALDLHMYVSSNEIHQISWWFHYNGFCIKDTHLSDASEIWDTHLNAKQVSFNETF